MVVQIRRYILFWPISSQDLPLMGPHNLLRSRIVGTVYSQQYTSVVYRRQRQNRKITYKSRYVDKYSPEDPTHSACRSPIHSPPPEHIVHRLPHMHLHPPWCRGERRIVRRHSRRHRIGCGVRRWRSRSWMPSRFEDEGNDEAEYDQQQQEDALSPPGVLLVPERSSRSKAELASMPEGG